MGWKILIPKEMRPEGRNYLENLGHTLVVSRGADTLTLMKDMKDADAVITRSAYISREAMNAAKNLKAIACLGPGYTRVDLKAAKDRGIKVVNCPEANMISTVETTIFYMLYCARQFTRVRRDFIDDYDAARESEEKQELWNKTLGIVGCGRVGSRVAKICMESFHMKVLAYDPYKPAADFPKGVHVIRKLPELLAESDYVSLHMFPRREIQFGMNEFCQMRPTAYLINMAYRHAVAENELYAACRDHVIAGAALDYLETVPPDPKNPLLYMDNVLIAPNIAAATHEADTRTSLQAAMGIQEIYSGAKPSFEAMEPDWEHMVVYHDVV